MRSSLGEENHIMLSLEINSEFTIHPLISVENLLHFPGLRVNDLYNGYCWYEFVTYSTSDKHVAVGICFHEGHFSAARLSLWDSAIYGTSWSDWTEQKQKLCARDTEEWLRTKGFEPGEYEWGSVWVGYDEKSASGHSLIQYKMKHNKSDMATPLNASD